MIKKVISPLILLLILTMTYGAIPGFGGPHTIETTLTALEKKYGGKSFEALFQQTSTLSALDITETASGKVWFSHPGKMKWQYQSPEHHEILTNGKDLWIFRPKENQAMHGIAERFFTAGAGGAFLSDISLVRSNYIPHIKTETSDYITLVLISKKPTPDVSSIELRVSLVNDQIDQVITRNQHGDTTLFDLSEIVFRPSDPTLFEFQPPQGVTIIEMD